MSRQGALLELQSADDHVAALQAQAAALGRSLAGDPELDRRRVSARELGAERDAAQAAVDALEREAGELRRHAALVERRMFDGSVRNPADLLTMQHELDGMRAQLATLEDRELEAMERAEGATAAADAAGAAVTELEERRLASAGPDRDRLAAIRAELVEAAAQRDAAAAAVEPADLALYTRLASRLHPVVVTLNGDTCGGCRLPMSHSEARDARVSERPVQCTNCDRILAP